MLTSCRDEELVVRTAQAVLDKYGADSNLYDLLRGVSESIDILKRGIGNGSQHRNNPRFG